MNVTIDLNDEQMNKLIHDGIENLSAESKSELVMAAISNYLNKPDVMESLLVEKSYYSSYNSKPSKFLIELIAQNVDNEKIKVVQDQILNYVTIHKAELFRGALVEVMTGMIMTESFKEALNSRLCHIEDKMFPEAEK